MSISYLIKSPENKYNYIFKNGKCSGECLHHYQFNSSKCIKFERINHENDSKYNDAYVKCCSPIDIMLIPLSCKKREVIKNVISTIFDNNLCVIKLFQKSSSYPLIFDECSYTLHNNNGIYILHDLQLVTLFIYDKHNNIFIINDNIYYIKNLTEMYCFDSIKNKIEWNCIFNAFSTTCDKIINMIPI